MFKSDSSLLEMLSYLMQSPRHPIEQLELAHEVFVFCLPMNS